MRPFIEDDNFTLEFASPLVRAEAMTEYLGHVVQAFRERRKAKRGAVDRGGKENIFRSTHGHEKLMLARECADLFDKCGQGHLITRTETGPFFRFVCHVYDFAVGNEADGGGRGLGDPIRQLVREHKEQMAIVARLPALWRSLR